MTARWLTGILAVAAVTRIAYLAVFAATDPLFDHLLHDALGYHRWASALAAGEVWEPGPFYQAPLYPYVLSFVYRAFGPNPAAGYALNHLLGLATIALVYRIGRRTWGPVSGLVGSALAALYGVFLFHEARLLPASLTVSLSVLAVDRMQVADRSKRARHWLIAGGVVGLAGTASPGSLLLAPAAAIWIAIDRARSWRERTARVASLSLGACLLVAPVTVQNLAVGDDFVPISTNGGITFYQGNNPSAEGVFSSPAGFSGSIFTQREESRRLAERDVGRTLRDSEVSAYWFRRGLDFVAGNRVRYVWLLARKAGFALDDFEQPLEYNPQLDPNPVRYAAPLPFALVLGLATIRFVARPRPGREETPAILLILATLATLLLFYVSGRYRLPAMPALLLFAGRGAVLLRERLRPSLPLLAGAVAALVSLFLMAAWAPDLRARQEAMALCDRAGAYLAQGGAAEAIALYRRATTLDPDYPFAHVDLAKALRAAGDTEGAERTLREAIRLAPRLAEAHFDLGVLLYGAGRLAEAADAFAEALASDPDYTAAANNLAGTCIRLGREEQAVAVWRTMRERGLAIDPEIEAWMKRRLGTREP